MLRAATLLLFVPSCYSCPVNVVYCKSCNHEISSQEASILLVNDEVTLESMKCLHGKLYLNQMSCRGFEGFKACVSMLRNKIFQLR